MTELEIVELPGADPSRVIWVQAGIHGDEVDGVLGLDLFVEAARTLPPPVTLRVVRPANPAAYHAGARCAPDDGLDLNRCFPGDPSGSPSEQRAAQLWSVIRECDAVVDIHSSSLTLVGYPHVIVRAGDEPAQIQARAAARASGVPIVWVSTGSWLTGSLLHTAGAAGIPACLLDIGSSRPWEPVPQLGEALSRTLGALASPPGPLPAMAAGQLEITDPQWLSAPVEGALVSCRAPGETVAAGEEVFVVRHKHGYTPVTWPGPEAGLVVTVRADRAVVAQTPVASVAALGAQAPPEWTAAQRRAAGNHTDGRS